MSILKAYEKKRAEVLKGEGKPPRIADFQRVERVISNPPEAFAEEGFAIGKPNSAFNEQTSSGIGKALPDSGAGITAGATLNAVGSVRPETTPKLDFPTWEIDLGRIEPRLVAISQPHSSYCEEYRSLRTQVLHKSQKQKLQSIVVASVGPNEGKSVTALNLAWLLAQTDGVRALLIDSDLRLPSLSEYLGLETSNRGLSEVLAGRSTLNDSIIKLEPSGLHLLPGGEPRSDVAELLSGPRFKDILREAREMFDYVIIDAPPLAVFTDAAVLINHADGAILVVRVNQAKYKDVDRILEQLPRERMMGVVVNQSDELLDESSASYGYYRKRQAED